MSVNNIIKNHHCMICGACSSICPKSAIKVEYNNKSGFMYMSLNPSLCVNCNLCEKSCPSLNPYVSNSLCGDYRSIFLAHSNNINVRNGSTSGGMVNTFVQYLINKDIVDAVLMVVLNTNTQIESGTIIINKNNVHLLKEKPRDFASRYVVVPLLSDIKSLDNYKRFAVVGTSCQMQALSLMKCLKSYKNKSILKIGITCSGGMSYLATEEYKRKMNMPSSTMFYRGNGWPGSNSLVYNNSSLDFNHLNSFYERMFSSQIFKNKGCRYCRDHFAETADISFCDFWNPDELSKEKNGNSCVIVRSDKAEKLLFDMVNDNAIQIVKDLDEIELANSQMHVLKVKKGNTHKSLFMRLFYYFCDFVFKSKIYRCFNIRTYKRIALIYYKLCNKINI